MGKRAKICTAKSTSAKTDRLSGRRDASTTDADIAAFIESTDVSLEALRMNDTPHKITIAKAALTFRGSARRTSRTNNRQEARLI